MYSSWDMLGAPSIIAGAPSNLLEGQVCPSLKNFKRLPLFSRIHFVLLLLFLFFPLPGAFSSTASPAAASFAWTPLPFEVSFVNLPFGFIMHCVVVALG